MLTAPTDPHEAFRRAELRLRVLLLGDENSTPGVVRGGEETRLRVRAELRRMRQAMDELAAPQEPEPIDLTEELRRAAAQTAAGLTPAEAARALDVSLSTIYRAVRRGDIHAVHLAGRKRGGTRIPVSEVHRLVEAAASGE